MKSNKILLFIILYLSVNSIVFSQKPDFKIDPLTKISETYPCVPKGEEFLVFSSDRDGDMDLYILDLNEQSTKQLFNLPGEQSHVDISPDDLKLTFYSTVQDGENSYSEIFTSDINGTNIKQITHNNVTSFHPKFSSDGKSILYNKQVSSEIDRFEFYLFNLETGEQKLILSDSNNITFGSFSPDGSKLLFVKWFENMNTEIFIANANGSNQQNISNHQLFDGWPSWSSNGKEVIFASDRDEKFHFHLYSFNLENKKITKITQGDRQYIQPEISSSSVIYANSYYSRDSSGQIIKIKKQN